MTPPSFSSSNASSNLHGIAPDQALPSVAGKLDTTCTDYFRLKALGLDPDTPAVPLVSKKRPRAHQSPKKEKRLKPLLDRQGAKLSSHSISEQSGQHQNTQPLQRHELAMQDEDDSDEALFARSRRLRETMSESISWLRSERRSSSGIGALVDETPTKKQLKVPWPTLSRTEQRLRATGAHGLLPKAWEDNPSWRDVNGHISTHTSPLVEDEHQRSHPEVSTTAVPNKRKATVPWTIEPMNVHGVSKGREVKWGFAGSSAEDAIEL